MKERSAIVKDLVNIISGKFAGVRNSFRAKPSRIKKKQMVTERDPNQLLVVNWMLSSRWDGGGGYFLRNQSVSSFWFSDEELRVVNRFGKPGLVHLNDDEDTQIIEALLKQQILINARRRVLITGCGRSGTKFIANALSSCQLDIGHEQIGEDGIASWCMAVKADDAPWGPPRAPFEFQHIFHQTRHPLKTIASMQTFESNSWEYIKRYIPCTLEEPLLLRCAKYWYYWNQLAEKQAEWRFQLEDISNAFPALCDRLSIPEVDRAPNLPPPANTRKGMYSKVQWKDIESLDTDLCHRIQEQAVRYGYEI